MSQDTPEAVARIEAILPQTQCRQCGYSCCAEYARAIAAGEAINRCAAGGEAGIRRLAAATGRDFAPLDPACGQEMPFAVAAVDPTRCIGCRVCTAECPVDAVVGIPGRMHGVLEDWCTGCGLCVAPCPLDAIRMQDRPDRVWTDKDAAASRARYLAKQARKNDPRHAKDAGMDARRRADFVRGVVSRVRARRGLPDADG